MIDIHVHLRDFEESHKETIAHALSVASSAGYSALFEMPNTCPPLTSRIEIERRIAFADQVLFQDQLPVFHGLYAGVTAERNQILEMVSCVEELFPRVVGLKLYAGPSTGSLGITQPADRAMVLRELAEVPYRGVLAVHCEDQRLFDIREGLSHGEKRPPEAELSSVEEMLDLAVATGFSGTLHICHVTNAAVLDLIERRRASLSCRVSTGVTPHHLLLNEELASGEGGYLFTVNPPLRSEEIRESLFQAVLDGRVDVLESDHAPHELADKRAGAAGLPGIPGMLCAVAYLVKHGIDGSLLTRMIFEHPLEILGLEPEMLFTSASDDQQQERLSILYRITNMFDQITSGGWKSLCEKYRQNMHEYPWDPYQSISREEL